MHATDPGLTEVTICLYNIIVADNGIIMEGVRIVLYNIRNILGEVY